MEGTEVILTDMLQCRERRAEIQNQYIKKYNCPVLSFCMNIPGPVKTNHQIRKAFEQGMEALFDALSAQNIVIRERMEIHEKTGDELLMAVDCRADLMKKITEEIEEIHKFGRLFDMDVIDMDGTKLSRKTYRKCLICDCQAQECSRTRKHSIEEMQKRIEEILSTDRNS
ncbi:MAG: citrate lyase holo-[acyl-carrier protein] synthase [Lachnospiraceae bacterium]|nr:citrate lyase holo-[acyl-carrier protein] synthase [Lachnospiraceae bacterium]MDY4971191.1 citrate lyase holo-[acyl-carrier protein] synthase [Lachnospiraceae bacterium]